LPSALVFIYLISQDPTKELFKTSTEIEPISTFEELGYKNYNSYLESFKKNISQLSESEINLKRLELIYNNSNKNYAYNNLALNDFIDYSAFKKINRIYLLDLFLEKITEDSFVTEAIKEFGLLKKEEFKNSEEYDDAILKSASQFQLSSKKVSGQILPRWFINFKTTDKKNYEVFLNFLEEKVNLEIQNYLKDNFMDSIENQKVFQNYMIEDINVDINNMKLSNLPEDDMQIEKLKKYKQNLLGNKTIMRLQFSFDSTPIKNSKNFYASKLILKSTEYTNLSNNDRNDKVLLKVILTAILSALFGIIFVFSSTKKIN
tara:strand:- start:839 stop:1792 length:954 start_codon:yes stop_codon:yes gene_type:complete